MATVYTNESRKFILPAYSQVEAKDVGGKVRVLYFSRSTTDAVNGNLANGDVIDAGQLPKGARIIGGKLDQDALGSGVTLTVSLSVSSTALSGALDVAAAGEDVFANTVALNYGYELTVTERLLITVGGGTPASSKVIKGHLLYVID